MQRFVTKRDGSKEPYLPYKIADAIRKAYLSESAPFDARVLHEVLGRVEKMESLEVESIQDLIEETLHEAGAFKVMKSFITYRFLHKLQRDARLEGGTTFVNATQSVQEYITKTDWRISANANTGYSNAGLINNLAGKVIANFWLDSVFSSEEGAAHRSGDLHIHDLDCLSGYCAGWSLRALLNERFNGVRGRVESAPPRHFREALGQMANFLGILQSEWAGAQAFSSFDTYLAPYVFADELSFAEVKKAVRSFVYNLNVPARWGQSPFTNITIDWSVPDDLRAQIPTCNNRHLFERFEHDDAFAVRAQSRGAASPKAMTYAHFAPEMELINRAYYEVMTEGDRMGSPFTFPIPTVNITEDFDWYGPNTELLFENTSKIGSSYFQNFIGSQYTVDASGARVSNPDAYQPGAVRSMCCRLQLDLRELLRRGNGLFGSAEMTGSIGVVTNNMARLGYRYCGDEAALIEALEAQMERAYSILEKKRRFVNDLFDRGLYPYTARYLKNFNNHFSTIGVNGMNEMVRNFTQDQEDLSTPLGIDFCLRLLDRMRERIRRYQEQSGNLYNLEATPAEGTTYRFAKEDKKRYPEILQAGEGENVYYTNSSQLPVGFSDDPFEALELQDALQCRYTGGTVLHLYMGERVSSAEACRRMVRNVLSRFRLPYITVTPLFSICPIHGYLSGEHEFCPRCDALIPTQEAS
ncbi:MAG: ribonucleoside triphosphate reductase [Campylobacterales bacterium]|nr:ribonucleoside triphosphate reductase [Campylobacterales bacterium]